MVSLAIFLLLGSCSSLMVDARSNQNSMDASVAKAKRKFHSYQSDPLNLLRGIQAGEYNQIYIQYHRCVWSEFGNNGDDNGESGCNGDGDGDDNPWYMGNTQCYRANVAYSLYGVRTGDTTPENACRRRYYINTFFTNNGMEDFGTVVGLENYGDATSQCALAEEEDDNNNNEDGGDDDSFQHNVEMYPNAHSYTSYCASGRFVTALFNGAYCTGKGELEMMDTLTNLNSELNEVDCVLAYVANEDSNNGGDENENDRQLEDEGNDGDEEDESEDEESEGLWDLLSYSSTCSILEYPKGCPDPYGAKKRFDLNPRTSNGISKQLHWIDWLTLILFVLGACLLVLTFFIKDREQKVGNKPKRKCFGFRRNRSKSRSKPRESSTSDKNSNNVDDSDTVNTYEEPVEKPVEKQVEKPVEKKKRGAFRGLFSRKN